MQYQQGIRDNNNNNINNNPSSSHLNEFYKQCYGLNDSITDLRDIIDDISYSLADALDEAFLPPSHLLLNTKRDNGRNNSSSNNKKDGRSIAHHVDTSRTTSTTSTSMVDHRGIDDSSFDSGDVGVDRMSSYLGISKDIHLPFFMDQDYHDHYNHHTSNHGESNRRSNSSKLLGEDERAVGRKWSTFRQVIREGDQLEHFHTYIPTTAAVRPLPSSPVGPGQASSSQLSSDTKNNNNKMMKSNNIIRDPVAIDYHTDAGLFILFIPALYSDDIYDQAIEKKSKDFSFLDSHGHRHVLQTYSQAVATTNSSSDDVIMVSPDTIIFMVGQGAAQWINPSLRQLDSKSLLRPVPHSLRLSRPEDNNSEVVTRNWYGRMFLPPADAFIPGGGSILSSGERYGNIRQRLSSRSLKATNDVIQQDSLVDLQVGCGVGELVSNEKLETTISSSSFEGRSPDIGLVNHYISLDKGSLESCGSGSIYCWAKCMSTSSLTCSSSQYECIDTSTGEKADPSVHDTNNAPGCVGTSYVDPGGFCQGSGTTMYMQGFVSYASGEYRTYGGSKTPECLSLFFIDWVLDTPWKFALACIGSFFLGILVESLSFVRRLVKIYVKESPEFLEISVTCFLYGCQATLGYFAMLVAMTYQVELFVSIIAGLIVGHGIFNRKSLNSTLKSARRSVTESGYKSDVVNRITTPLNETTEFSSDPCCSFLNLEETEDNDQNDGDHHAPVTKSWLNSASNQKK